MKDFKSGFVNIIGRPNAGKSTLLNLLIGEKLAAITSKAQTTRRRILGINSDEKKQIIYSDTPGIVKDPQYKLHNWMNAQIEGALQDADIIIYLTNEREKPEETSFFKKIQSAKIPVCIALNKCDLLNQEQILIEQNKWNQLLPHAAFFAISSLKNMQIDVLKKYIDNNLPVHPPYFDMDELTDATERFIASEFIRAEILKLYKQEIPYSVEVMVQAFEEKQNITVIKAMIFTERESHKNIIIGNKGASIKKLGMQARKEIEAWHGRKVFLELFIKVKEGWKDDDRSLQHFGYHQ